jgi:hypothetical protein
LGNFFLLPKGDKIMSEDVEITTEQLTKAMDAEYQKLVKQVKGAVNQAPDGAVRMGH